MTTILYINRASTFYLINNSDILDKNSCAKNNLA